MCLDISDGTNYTFSTCGKHTSADDNSDVVVLVVAEPMLISVSVVYLYIYLIISYLIYINLVQILIVFMHALKITVRQVFCVFWILKMTRHN